MFYSNYSFNLFLIYFKNYPWKDIYLGKFNSPFYSKTRKQL